MAASNICGEVFLCSASGRVTSSTFLPRLFLFFSDFRKPEKTCPQAREKRFRLQEEGKINLGSLNGFRKIEEQKKSRK
jgi:hypothetical protein